MADPTYQPKAYMSRPGDEQVIASGGKITVESGGEIEMQSGGFFDAQSGSSFYFADQVITAGQMQAQLAAPATSALIIGQGVVSTVMSVVNLPRNYRYVFLSMTSTCIAASFWLTSCLVGDEVFLMIKPGSTVSNYVTVSTSGCTLFNILGVAISGFKLYTSGASCGWAHLVCMEDTVWSVVGRSSAASVVE